MITAELVSAELARPIRMIPIRSEDDVEAIERGAERLASGGRELVRLRMLEPVVTVERLVYANERLGLVPDYEAAPWSFEECAAWVYLMVLMGHWAVDPPLNPIQTRRWTIERVTDLRVHLGGVEAAIGWERAPAFAATVRAAGRLSVDARRRLVAEVLCALVAISERERREV